MSKNLVSNYPMCHLCGQVVTDADEIEARVHFECTEIEAARDEWIPEMEYDPASHADGFFRPDDPACKEVRAERDEGDKYRYADSEYS
jgi:hypothetical protein